MPLRIRATTVPGADTARTPLCVAVGVAARNWVRVRRSGSRSRPASATLTSLAPRATPSLEAATNASGETDHSIAVSAASAASSTAASASS
jgi:hypothetical protein